MAVYRIADLNIDIRNKEKYTSYICKNYLAENQFVQPDITAVSDASEYETDKKAVPEASDGYLESLSIYRSISNQLIDFCGFILHASVVEKDGYAFAFSAHSGTGKTTHSRIWTERFPDARIINGDKPLVRIFDDNVYIYGTPWCGKENYNINTKAPLKALCFIERSQTNSISTISKQEAVMRIYSQLLIPADKDKLNRLLDLVGELIDRTPVYLLKCNMEPEAAEVAYKGMTQVQDRR